MRKMGLTVFLIMIGLPVSQQLAAQSAKYTESKKNILILINKLQSNKTGSLEFVYPYDEVAKADPDKVSSMDLFEVMLEPSAGSAFVESLEKIFVGATFKGTEDENKAVAEQFAREFIRKNYGIAPFNENDLTSIKAFLNDYFVDIVVTGLDGFNKTSFLPEDFGAMIVSKLKEESDFTKNQNKNGILTQAQADFIINIGKNEAVQAEINNVPGKDKINDFFAKLEAGKLAFKYPADVESLSVFDFISLSYLVDLSRIEIHNAPKDIHKVILAAAPTIDTNLAVEGIKYIYGDPPLFTNGHQEGIIGAYTVYADEARQAQGSRAFTANEEDTFKANVRTELGLEHPLAGGDPILLGPGHGWDPGDPPVDHGALAAAAAERERQAAMEAHQARQKQVQDAIAAADKETQRIQDTLRQAQANERANAFAGIGAAMRNAQNLAMSSVTLSKEEIAQIKKSINSVLQLTAEEGLSAKFNDIYSAMDKAFANVTVDTEFVNGEAVGDRLTTGALYMGYAAVAGDQYADTTHAESIRDKFLKAAFGNDLLDSSAKKDAYVTKAITFMKDLLLKLLGPANQPLAQILLEAEDNFEGLVDNYAQVVKTRLTDASDQEKLDKGLESLFKQYFNSNPTTPADPGPAQPPADPGPAQPPADPGQAFKDELAKLQQDTSVKLEDKAATEILQKIIKNSGDLRALDGTKQEEFYKGVASAIENAAMLGVQKSKASDRVKDVLGYFKGLEIEVDDAGTKVKTKKYGDMGFAWFTAGIPMVGDYDTVEKATKRCVDILKERDMTSDKKLIEILKYPHQYNGIFATVRTDKDFVMGQEFKKVYCGGIFGNRKVE